MQLCDEGRYNFEMIIEVDQSGKIEQHWPTVIALTIGKFKKNIIGNILLLLFLLRY